MKIRFFNLLMTFLVSCSAGLLYAQTGEPVHVRVELNNHQTVEGQILVQQIPVILSIYISETDSIAIPTKIIRRIVFEKEPPVKPRNGIRYFNNTFIGMQSGRTNSQSAYRAQVTVEMVNGIKFNTWLWTGLGLTFDQYQELDVLPLSFTIMGDLLERKFTPFYFFDIGSGPSWIDEDQWGNQVDSDAKLMFHFGGGFKVYADDNIHIMFAFGYKNQEAEIKRDLWNGQEEITTRNYKNFTFRIGVGF